jgi:Xaa-Pro aminopeptidase
MIVDIRSALIASLALVLAVAPANGQGIDGGATDDSGPFYGEDRPSPEFHRDRRQAVLDALPDDAVAIVLASPERARSNDVDYEYHPSSDLYYLTGMTEPSTILLLVPGGTEVGGKTVQEILVVRARDPATEVWTGRRLGAEGAMRELGVQLAVEPERFEEIAGPLIETRRPYVLPWPAGLDPGSEYGAQVAWLKERIPTFEPEPGRAGALQRGLLRVNDAAAYDRARGMVERMAGAAGPADGEAARMARAFVEAGSVDAWLAWRDSAMAGFANSTELESVLSDLREVKTEEELRFLQAAIDATAAAHRQALRSIEPGMREYEVEAVIEYVFHRAGAEHTGFPSIVGSGENSTILHYESNRRRMEDGDLVVMDIGAEYRGYSADVTRTAPVNGRFSEPQRQIYEIVLAAQEAAIAVATPGAGFRDLNEAASTVLAEGLERLGIIGSSSELRRYFPHGVSHYLGLDVHDVGTYGPFRPGDVVTVEPGIYIRPGEGVDERWWNVGVRIEDDILITPHGPVVLSAEAPKTVAEIEALMAEPGPASLAAGE